MIPSTTLASIAILDAVKASVGLIDRRCVEYAAIDSGVAPNDLSKHLRVLNETGQLLRTEFVGVRGAPAPIHAYSIDPPGPDLIAAERSLLEQRSATLRSAVLRRAGETYARFLFRHARDHGATWFGTIPQKRSLGYIPLRGTSKLADLVVPLCLPGASNALIECKNTREHFDLTNSLFAKLIDTALSADMQPILVTAYLSPRAERLCSLLGIAVVIVGCQVYPHDLRGKVRKVYPKFGRTKFRPIRLKRVSGGGGRMPEWIKPSLDAVSSFEWIDSARRSWIGNRDLAGAVSTALRAFDWGGLASLSATMESRVEALHA